ncbi:MAG: hypothetical protein JHD07_00715 [Bradyrhizobium sp.]|jgi:CRP/FNR family nitrogen fixation transcriptional regulator|uniref:hypothetical protein n=1 Tax=Bradyrhizobium sp. TaxID=376 RepID=UPI001A1B1BFF|nr:hypothetical protein [Bradyrhizobium sp.]MBJ7401897.1 hypothetical protein [Bradyrhizobium sp.]
MIAKLTCRRRDVTQQLMNIASEQTKQCQEKILLLTKTAEERMAWFLLQLSKRLKSGNLVILPRPRQDIVDQLGLMIETARGR